MSANPLMILQKEVDLEVSNTQIVVDDEASKEVAAELVLNIDGLRKKVEAYWSEPKRQAHESWKTIVAREKEMLEPLESARKGLRDKIDAYSTEIWRREQVEKARLEAEREAAEEAERQQLIKQAKLAKEEGNDDEAESLAEQAEMVYVPREAPEVALEKTTRTSAGSVSAQEDIEFEIRDKKALCQALLDKDLLDIIEIKQAKLKQYLKLTKPVSFPGLSIKTIIRSTFRGKTA
jgi:hypothetical protein